MKNLLLNLLCIILLFFPKINFGQTAPNLGTTSGFALFTAAGAFTNTGASVVIGDIGSFTSSPTGFPIPGTVVGTIYNVGAPILTSAAADVAVAYSDLTQGGAVIGVGLGNGQILIPGVYQTGAASTLNGNITLDGGGDPNALFIIRIGGAFAAAASSTVTLTGSASLCNVYWQIGGQFDLADGSVFRGTAIVDGPIHLLGSSSLQGRGLSKAGAISLVDNVVNFLPEAAGIIIGTAAVCQGQAGVSYSVPVITNATGYIWSLPAGATIVAGSNTNAVTVDFSAIAGSGNITVQGSSSCGNGTVSPNFAVIVNPAPAAVAGANRAICLNSNTQIGAATVIGNTYSWTSVPVGFTSIAANPTVTPLVTTTYTVVETTTATGCTNSNSVVVTVNPIPAAVAGANRSICLNSNTQIGAAAVIGNTYSWTSVPVGFTSIAANPTITPLVTTTYTVVETITATGCTNSNSVVVTVNPIPAAVAGANRAICLNTSTQIGAAAVIGNTYSWTSVPAGFISIVANPTVTPLVTTTYTVVETITATGCTNSNSVVVTVNPIPAAVAGANRSICLNSNTQIGAAAVIGNTYSWTSVPVGFTSIAANPTITPLVTTTYTVVETITATGCTNNHSVVVTMNPLPAAVAGANRSICLNSNTQIGAAAVLGNTYSWTSVPVGFTSSAANPIVTPLGTTTYTVVETITATTGCTNSNSVVVTVNPLPAAVAGANRAICLNSNTQIGAVAVIGSTYSWTSVPAGFISIVANPTVTPLVTTTYTVVETITATGCTNSNSVIVTENPLPAAVAGANRTVDLNTSTQIGAVAVPGSTYSWSSVPIGFISIVANPTVTPLANTTYTVVETITATGCINSNSVVVTVNPLLPVSVSVVADANPVSAGTSATFTATPTNGGTAPVYQWEVNGINVGINSNTYSYVPVNTDVVTVVLTSNAVNPSGNPATSAPVTMTVNPLLAVSVSVVADANPVSAGTSVTFTATPTNGGTAPVYQWEVNGINVGINSNTYSYIPVNNDVIKVVLTSNAVNPSGNPATSAPVTMTVNPLLAVSVSVVADANPVSAGTSVTFTATPTNGGTVPVYQWKVNGINVGINSNTYSYLPVNNDVIKVVLTSNAVNPSGNPATSAPVTMTVDPLLAVSVSVVADANPVSAGTSVTFTATPTNGGTAPVYQWEVNGINVGINSNTYSYIPVNNDVIKVVLTSNAVNPSGNPATSAPVTMTVNPLLAVSVSVVADANPVSAGTSVTFTATPTNGGTAPVYQWEVNGINVGINSNTYSYIPVNNDVIKVVLTSNAVNPSGNPATSAPVTMIVNSCPSITTEPVNQTACDGSSVSFSVTATGAGLTYQWRKGMVNLINGGNISGANSPTLTIDPVNISDAASNYNVVVTGTATCLANATSTDVSLIVNPTTPTIIIQPENQILCPGCPAIFSVEVTGTGLTYQWRRGTVNLVDGGNIYGATSATLIIDLVSSADVATDYNVVITGPCAPITTKNASLSLCTTTGIASLDAGNITKAITIYPNPFTTSIDIRINDASQLNNCQLRIYNDLGEEVINTILTNQLTTLETSHFTSGIYMYKVIIGNNKTIQTGKLVSKQ